MGNCLYYKNKNTEKKSDKFENLSNEITKSYNKTFSNFEKLVNISTYDLIPIDYNIEFHENYENMLKNLKIKKNNKFVNISKDEILLGQFDEKNNNINGYSFYKNKENCYYIGNFKDNLFEGFGIFISKKGIYKGNFIEGKKNGEGKYINFKSQIKLEGIWKDDIFTKGEIYKNDKFISNDINIIKINNYD